MLELTNKICYNELKGYNYERILSNKSIKK